MRGRRFQSGEDYETTIVAVNGPVGLLAEVEIAGSILTLKDVAIYPLDAVKLDVGVGAIKRLFRQVADEAKAEGFSQLRITATRYSGAHAGRVIDVIINLTE